MLQVICSAPATRTPMNKVDGRGEIPSVLSTFGEISN
jgi:hypothetical protein